MSSRVRVQVEVADLEARAEAAAQAATATAMADLNAAFQESFDFKAWDWPRDLPTRKLSGATLREKLANYRKGRGIRAGNPRNLIDNGNPGLRGAHLFEMTSPYQARFVWWAPYARLVHEGGWIWAWGRRPPQKGARAVYLPPRPWTRAVLGQEQVAAIQPFPLQQRLRDVWLAHFRQG